MDKSSPGDVTHSYPGETSSFSHDGCAPASGRSERTARRRRQVLDASSALFRRHGFHNTSMAQIAAEAGMSVGHIYRYFENKEAIIAAIVEEDLQQGRETIVRMTEDPAGRRAAILAGVDEGVAKMLHRADSALFLEVMAEAARNPKVARSAELQHQAALDCLGAILPKQDGAGPFTREQAIDLLNLIFSGLRLRAIQDPDPNPARLTDAIRAFLAELVGAEPSA